MRWDTHKREMRKDEVHIWAVLIFFLSQRHPMCVMPAKPSRAELIPPPPFGHFDRRRQNRKSPGTICPSVREATDMFIYIFYRPYRMEYYDVSSLSVCVCVCRTAAHRGKKRCRQCRLISRRAQWFFAIDHAPYMANRKKKKKKTKILNPLDVWGRTTSHFFLKTFDVSVRRLAVGGTKRMRTSQFFIVL